MHFSIKEINNWIVVAVWHEYQTMELASKEICNNHRQIFLKIANIYNIQQENFENLGIMKNIFQNHRQISVVWTQSNYLSLNLATDAT